MSGQKTKTSKTSKGERKSVSPAICRAVRRERTYLDKMLMKQKAWQKGQNPWVTIPNPNTNETNKRFIKVRANQEWGDPKAYVKVFASPV